MKRKNILKKAFAVIMATSVVFAYSAVAMAHDDINNQHDADCYATATNLTCELGTDSKLICDLETDTVLDCDKGPVTELSCTLEKTLICGLGEGALICTEEVIGHTPACYTHNGNGAKVHKDDTSKCVTIHTHTESCYHVHSDDCYSHVHTEECYTTTAHEHGDDCYATVAHEHLDTCYETHAHGDDCYTTTSELICEKKLEEETPAAPSVIVPSGTTTPSDVEVTPEGSEPAAPAEPAEDEITGDAPGSEALGAGGEVIDSDPMGDPDTINGDDAEEDISATPKGVKTGDETAPWAMGFAGAIIALGGAVALRRREEE